VSRYMFHDASGVRGPYEAVHAEGPGVDGESTRAVAHNGSGSSVQASAAKHSRSGGAL